MSWDEYLISRGFSFNELSQIDGGFNWEGILSGAMLGAVGVGCVAIAMTPGLNVVAAASAAYVGSWGLAGGAMATIYGLVV